ncbi:MAG: hypothetical protein RR585_14795, partial [Coprobacillus sp.]
MKVLYVFIALFLVFVPVIAQSGSQNDLFIKGILVDVDRLPIAYASIRLLSTSDSTTIAGVISNEKGMFTLIIHNQGRYILDISHISFQKKVFPINLQLSKNLDSIILPDNSLAIKGTVVSAMRIKPMADGYIANMEGDKVAKGKSTDELLKFLPGVTNENGVLRILGRSVTRVYLNGIKIKDTKELETIPAEYIKTVKVNYLAGSEEQANLQGGVIEVILQKPKDGGYYGNIEAGVSFIAKYGFQGEDLSAVINYQKGKFNIYNSLSYYDNLALSDYQESTVFKETKGEIVSTNEYRNWQRDLRNRLSLTADISSRQTVGVSFMFNLG